MSSVWTVLYKNNKNNSYEASVMYGAIDSKKAWDEALHEHGNVVALWKGNMADNVITSVIEKK
jgi:hypothetical protein